MPKHSGPTDTPGGGHAQASIGLVLLSRAECGLCEEFLAELAAREGQLQGFPVTVVDVDDYPELARRHGLDIPVLLWDGVKVCQHHLDFAELERLLRPRQAARPL